MRKYLVIRCLILFVLLILTSGCSSGEESDNMVRFKERLLSNVKSQYVRDEINLLVDNNIADIVINQTDTNMVNISLDKEVEGTDEEKVHETFDQINYDIYEEMENIIINSTNYDEVQKEITELNIKCTIEVPKLITTLKIKSKQGNISINGTYNEISVKLVAGNVEINGAKQKKNTFEILEKEAIK